MKRCCQAILFLLLVAFSAPAIAADGGSLSGLWLNDEKSAQIEIYRTGDRYAGKIVFLKDPVYPGDDAMGMAGQTKIDRHNPDPLKRNKPLLGLQILDGFRQTGERVWENGHIYDPKNGKTYRCKITLEKTDTLAVRGFIGISLLGRTATWTRVK